MSLTTYSRFFYGQTVDSTNFAIDFNEGGSEIQASLNIDNYSLSEYVTEIARAMNAVGGQTYSVSVDRSTRKITISAASNFTLLGSTGSRVGSGAWGMMGFASSDVSGANTYTGGSASGSSYDPQFYLQNYIAPTDWKTAVSATVNESASGKIEVVTFGSRQFIQMNMRWSTDKTVPGNPKIKAQSSAIDNLRSFMDYATTKAAMEFMPDLTNPSTFYKVILESTQASKAGTDYMLHERYDLKAPGYFDTDDLIFRVKS